jgi:hypothetical protein
MIEWFKRRSARKIWRSMLKYYQAYGVDMEAQQAAYFVLAMDHMKRTSEGRE